MLRTKAPVVALYSRATTNGETVGSQATQYVPAALSKVGTELAVRIRERDVPAKVVKTPFYKRGG